MRKLFLVTIAALGLGCGQYYSQTPITVRPRTAIAPCTSAGATELSPTSALFVTRATAGVGSVSQEAFLFVGRYQEQNLIVPEGNTWRLAVEPICRFSFGRNLFALTRESFRVIGGLTPGFDYTVLVVSRAPYNGGTVDISSRTFRLDGRFRPRQYRLDGYGTVLVNQVVRLPSARRHLGRSDFRATIQIP